MSADAGETEPSSAELPISSAAEGTVLAVILALSCSHLLNDTIQSLIAAVYPVLKEKYTLSFTQIGLITLAFQLTASLLQPVVGIYTDRRPQPFSLATGMAMTLVGLLLLSVADNFPLILVSAAMVGVGSSIFHPESSRVARLASGGRHGLAQSLFQVGGNAGTALGPLLAAFIVVPRGQASIAWFSAAAIGAMVLLTAVGRWYSRRLAATGGKRRLVGTARSTLSPVRVRLTIGILLLLIFSKYFYLASLTSYYTFYLIETFGVSVEMAEIYLFVFLGAVAVGTIGGGPVGDLLGFKTVIWVSILGVLPFSLILPHVNLLWTVLLSIPIGLILASAFPAIIVYAQELLPQRVGTVAGLFFGFAFGMGGLGAAVLGYLADETSIRFVYLVCSLLPLIGLLTIFLPNLRSERAAS
jgi:MFS transporter, FSR family, fosmidomycin resistance protein